MRLDFLRHECGRLIWQCECGYTTAAILIGSMVVSAASKYASSSMAGASSAAQARYARNQYLQRASAESAAGEAEAQAIGYSAGKLQRSFGSRAAARGVQAHEGSLMEEEMAFASETDYEKQMARYRHAMAGWADVSSANLFSYQGALAQRQGRTAGLIGAGTSLATGAARYYGMSSGRSPGGYDEASLLAQGYGAGAQ